MALFLNHRDNIIQGYNAPLAQHTGLLQLALNSLTTLSTLYPKSLAATAVPAPINISGLYRWLHYRHFTGKQGARQPQPGQKIVHPGGIKVTTALNQIEYAV